MATLSFISDEIEDFKITVGLIKSNKMEEYKKSLKLTQLQREMIVGVLLGDAHLESQNNGRTYRMKIEQSIAHKDYGLHLYEHFKDWILTPPKERLVVRGCKKSTNIQFQTISHPSLRFYGHQFYPNGVKMVPKLIHRWLSPMALTYWFMDDGSIKSKEGKGLILNTQSFSPSDIDRLLLVLRTRYGLLCSPQNKKNGQRQIDISGRSREIFEEIVTPHIVDSMRYKLSRNLTRMPKE